ncbi:MAG TPA: hypothetical protein PKK06_11640 [Phycisphaerae bacterium]|nr:hypothetical protein [Phycisphaerae bacterium]HNU45886.1 hypothetical protein [Phycisphaerae bacterium]
MLLGLGGMLPACGPRSERIDTKAEQSNPEARLRARAARLWDARQREDWATAFEFLDPDDRGGATVDAYGEWSSKNEPFVVRSFDLGRVLTEGTCGWVEVNASLAVRKYRDIPARPAHHWEKWRVAEGEWYPVSKKNLDNYPAAPPERDAAQEQLLRTRAEEAARAQIAREWDHLYELTDPRDRETVSREDLEAGFEALEFRSFEVHWVEVLSDRGVVRITYEHKLRDPSLTKMPATRSTNNEKWVRIDGQWYLDIVNVDTGR